MSFFQSFNLDTHKNRMQQASSLYEEEKKDYIHQSYSDEERCRLLKDHLRSLLAHHEGSTKSQDVIDAIESLTELCPYYDHSSKWTDLFMGEFVVQTTPNFPGRLPPVAKGDKQIRYTLGKLSFNTFHPNDVVCTLRGVRSVVAPNSDGTFSYNLICDTIIHLPGGDVEAEISNESYCCKDDETDRVHVFFTGSTLSPSEIVLKDGEKLRLWSNTFNEATLKAAAAKKTYFGWLMDQVLKRLLGMNVRLDESNILRLEFQKAIRGHVDVLYLDDEMRITKGNRGTLVVMERISKGGNHLI